IQREYRDTVRPLVGYDYKLSVRGNFYPLRAIAAAGDNLRRSYVAGRGVSRQSNNLSSRSSVTGYAQPGSRRSRGEAVRYAGKRNSRSLLGERSIETIDGELEQLGGITEYIETARRTRGTPARRSSKPQGRDRQCLAAGGT